MLPKWFHTKRQAQVAINVWLRQFGSIFVKEKNCREKKKRQYKCECRFRRTVGRCRSSLNNASLGLCFFIVCSFLFFCEFVVPLIITKAELCRRRLGFTMADLTAVIQKLLDRASSVVSFWTCCIADLISIIL